MNKLKKTIYGLALGLAVSVFINTIFIMLTSVWFLAYIIPVLIPVFASCAIFVTLALKNTLKTPNYYIIVAIFLLGIPLSYYIPVQIQTARFKVFSYSIPLEENSSKRITHLAVFGADSPAQVTTVITGHMPIPTMLGFYSDYLKRNSWRETEPTSTFAIRKHYSYCRGSSKVHIIGYRGGPKGDTNTVRLQRDYPTMGFR